MATIEDRWQKTIDGARQRTDDYGRGLRWRVRYRDPDGASRSKSFKRRDDAELFRSDVEMRVATASYIDPARGRALVDELARTWLSIKEATRKRKTAAGYRQVYRTLVAPTWARVPIDRVEYSGLQSWISELEGRGLSASRIHQAHNVMRGILKLAVRDRRIAVDPSAGVELPRVPTKSGRTYLTHGQLGELARRCGEHGGLVLVLGYTGMRWGEATALRVGDVDPMRKRVRVERAIVEVDGRLIVDTPKDHKSRWVPVAGPAWDAVEAAASGKPADALLFSAHRGGILRSRVFRRSGFDRAVAGMGLARFTPHDLRHTAASIAIASGASVLAVQRMLGHARASTTLDIYADLFDADLDDLAVRIGEAAAAAPAWEPPRSIAR